MFLVGFNPELPLVVASSFNGGERTYAAGDAFDWRALGMSELDVMNMYKANLLCHAQVPVVETPAPVKRKK